MPVVLRVAIAALAICVGLGASLPAAATEGAETDKWYDRIDFGGDFRARSEAFVIAETRDRHRLRYRLRLGAKTALNDYFDFGFRLATGPDANSGNQTIGKGIGFDPDRILVDRAYLTFKPHGDAKPMFGDSMAVTFGKMPNPFRPKGMGPAVLMWDADQMPEGVALGWSATPCDCWSTNLDVAYYVIEDTSKGDPGMFAVQLDNDVKLHENTRFKSQLSYYAMRKLNSDFLTAGNGNTLGLTDNNNIDLIEFQGAVICTAMEDWPLTLWGNVVYNASAQGIGQGKQGIGFGAGFTIGSKTAVAKLGLGYFQLEADAVPSLLADSDIFDGVTNGKGIQASVTRRLWKNVDFNLTGYVGKLLDKKVRPLQTKTPDKRVRIQTNIMINF
jgi:hypothetical protein